MKKVVKILGVIVIAFLVVFGVYLYKKNVAENAIDAYIAEYGIPQSAIRDESFGYANAPPGFVKIVYSKNEGDDIRYIFQYISKEKRVDYSAYIKGTEVGIDDPRTKELKYQPPASMQNQ
ncbi:hypothetical protein DUK53_07220 [Listeria sp. SHR_NRA_18]|uniref:hypothetical protein n=1 Tax=Listeria sp. SHR_NRA_18 TaxID=2269046 RepID=UPI00051CDCDA|nr:hypothetical protein [Listeria sp. SHR_NRA_18]KGL39428.1 hypothetical protein EP56_12750 [Listeriaceae bacterium FSL A5-0209]RQW66980.1 hypothetical protein DUK53_07220 [Listeria sp. SHR_NRA_18]